MERLGARDAIPGLPPAGTNRFLGNPRLFKGCAQLFTCDAEGVSELTVQRRDAPELFRQFKESRELPLQTATDSKSS
jgi:hypothetical protein